MNKLVLFETTKNNLPTYCTLTETSLFTSIQIQNVFRIAATCSFSNISNFGVMPLIAMIENADI